MPAERKDAGQPAAGRLVVAAVGTSAALLLGLCLRLLLLLLLLELDMLLELLQLLQLERLERAEVFRCWRRRVCGRRKRHSGDSSGSGGRRRSRLHVQGLSVRGRGGDGSEVG